MYGDHTDEAYSSSGRMSMASQVHVNSLNLGLNFEPGFENFKPGFKTQSAHMSECFVYNVGFKSWLWTLILRFRNQRVRFDPFLNVYMLFPPEVSAVGP